MGHAFSGSLRLSCGRDSSKRHTAITGTSHPAGTVNGVNRRHLLIERMRLIGGIVIAARGAK
jgi:hypothetical protein